MNLMYQRPADVRRRGPRYTCRPLQLHVVNYITTVASTVSTTFLRIVFFLD